MKNEKIIPSGNYRILLRYVIGLGARRYFVASLMEVLSEKNHEKYRVHLTRNGELLGEVGTQKIKEKESERTAYQIIPRVIGNVNGQSKRCGRLVYSYEQGENLFQQY